MPFQPRLLSQPMPSRYPDVDIVFHGQIFLRSEDGITCQAALNPIATDHVLSIEVRTKTLGESDVIRMRHIWPLEFRRPEGMTIDLNPRADILAAWKCITDQPIDYAEGGGDAQDFRWILNMEGNYFHRTNLTPAIFDSQHVIKLQGGEYYFRTGARSFEGLDFVRSGGGAEPFTFRRIGAVARAGLYLNQDQSVFLKWVQNGKPEVLTLTKSAAGVRHEIYIENTPLYDPIDPDELATHEELGEYYKLLPDIASAARFALKPVIHHDSKDTGTPTIPCQVLRLDDPTGD